MRSISAVRFLGFVLLAALAPLIVVSVGVAGGSPGQDFSGATPHGRTVVLDPTHTVARTWNEALLDAIRTDLPKPPVHARNLFHVSVAMWDAWAAYDPTAIGFIFQEKHTWPDVEAARHETLSYAAYRVLMHRFPGDGFDQNGLPCQPGAGEARARFDEIMMLLGYDTDFTATGGNTPAAIGNRIGQTVIDYGLADGAFEGNDLCYPDDSGYFSFNPELIFELPGAYPNFANQWQALAFSYGVSQNGIPFGTFVQTFVGVAWGDVKGFALSDGDVSQPAGPCYTVFGAAPPHRDPGCAPQLGGEGDDVLRDSVVELIRLSGWADPADGVEIDISPSVRGNNPLGTDDGTGWPVNPHTGEPYPPNVVKRADYARVIAEFWADGPESETPPGHWNVLAAYVTDHPDLCSKRIAGTGDPVSDLEWEVKLYLALNGAMHDAAVVAWGTKHRYDSSRPITLIRHMGGLGQSTDLGGPSYHPDGLPLVPGLIEVITPESTAAGERHQHLIGYIGEIAIRVWQGEPENPATEVGGVGWIRSKEWMPYQAATFVSPPFPGYTSGHSTFSRAGAEVLAAFTGDAYFPGGLGTFVAYAGEYLAFENGPSETVELQWATYADSADEAGASRRYGGIHPYFDDYPGRIQGEIVGLDAFRQAVLLYNQDVTGSSDSDEDEDEDEDSDCGIPADDEDSDDEGSDDESWDQMGVAGGDERLDDGDRGRRGRRSARGDTLQRHRDGAR